MKPSIREALDRLALEVQSDNGQRDLVLIEQELERQERDLDLACQIAREGLENAFRNVAMSEDLRARLEEFFVK